MGEKTPRGTPFPVSKLASIRGPKLSREQKTFNRTHRCIKCGRRMLNPAYSLPDGTVVSPNRLRGMLQGAAAWGAGSVLMHGIGAIPGAVVGGLAGVGFRDAQTRATCSRCGHCWDVFALTEPIPTPQGELGVQQIVETMRTEELIGDELRRVDNSSSSTSLVRRLRATRRWAKTYDIQVERTSTTTQGLDVALHDLAGYRSVVEAAVKQNYAISTEEEQTFEEEIELTVPARTNVQLCLHWKRLWQEGYVVISDGNVAANIPFRTVIGVTFDQESIDT